MHFPIATGRSTPEPPPMDPAPPVCRFGASTNNALGGRAPKMRRWCSAAAIRGCALAPARIPVTPRCNGANTSWSQWRPSRRQL
uniref:Uncharacterized protein n=1 Tax=Arundo donax TaxID=35708 RepID=A0A0A9GSF9_ARUDO